METANFLASVWGLSLVAVPLSLLINPKQIKGLFAALESETAMYVSGILCFILGTLSVLSNNIWSNDWRVIVTILGWATIIKGLYLLFFTERSLNMYIKMKDNEWISYAMLACVFLGLVTTYFGFLGK